MPAARQPALFEAGRQAGPLLPAGKLDFVEWAEAIQHYGTLACPDWASFYPAVLLVRCSVFSYTSPPTHK